MTPDSFSQDGLKGQHSQAIKQALQMIDDGADIIDIGGESTRPGSDPVTEKEERDRVIPIIKELRQISDIPISIDSYKSRVAREALENGATWLNDIWGLRYDKEMIEVAKEYNCPIVIMHNSRKLEKDPLKLLNDYNTSGIEYVNTVVNELKLSLDFALKNGVKASNMISDPGIGFGKNTRENISLLKHLDQFKKLNTPILVGTSRKRFVGELLGGRDAEDRLEATTATIAMASNNGANIVRVHDVRFISGFLKATGKLLE